MQKMFCDYALACLWSNIMSSKYFARWFRKLLLDQSVFTTEKKPDINFHMNENFFDHLFLTSKLQKAHVK